MVGGIAGGIPGPPHHPGAPRSGVAVATAAAEDSDTMAHIVAHEMGHFLGLSHTAEMFGIGDNLRDTPEGDRGQSNLMYFTAGSDSRLTPDQTFVMHNSPCLVPVEVDR
ncbi:MAG: hypothetical protein FJ125_09245 [Deltaproteobacteria bacterium]|nr:hypothetical protein [Deltaproteobacteria bacterium]